MRHFYCLIGAALLFSACASEAEYAACGNFEAEEIVVSSQGTGEILWLNVSEGMDITDKEVVGMIDTLQLHLQKVQLQAQLNSLNSSRPDIESQVASLKSQIRSLNSEKKRVENLIAKGAAPQKQLDDINTQIEVLENQLDAQQTSLKRNTSSIDYNASALQAQIAQLEDKIRRCGIASPLSGTVLAKYVNAGEMVAAGTPVMKVADIDNMYLRAYFTSDQLPQLSLGKEVKVRADFGGDRQYDYNGRIVWISSESEFTPKAIQTKNTRANLVYAVKIAVKNDGMLKIGMYGTVDIPDYEGNNRQ